MKKFTLPLFLFFIAVFNGSLDAQNVGINADGTAPNTSAMLDIDVSSLGATAKKGLLIPRVAISGTADNTTIPSAATGLLIYNTTAAGSGSTAVFANTFYYWNGTAWVALSGSGGKDWSLTGNAGTTAGTNFIGTTDPVDFVVKTNNAEVARVTSGGKVGIGLTPSMKLDVTDASTTANDATIRGTATGNAATFGVLGRSSSATGQGVFGFNSNATGTGVIGSGNNLAAQYLANGSGGAFTSSNVGVYGYGDNTSSSYGAYGISINATGVGVVGLNNTTTGEGINGYNAATSGTGDGNGVYGSTLQSAGSGVWGVNGNSVGTGVLGAGNGVTSAYLTSGSGGAFSGTRVGVYGRSTDETTAGTSYTSINTSYNAVLGYSTGNVSTNTDLYHFGVHGRYGDIGTANARRSGGVLGSNNISSLGVNCWSSLGYLAANSTPYALYYTTIGNSSGTGFNKANQNYKFGIGSGGVGGIIGSWTRGEVMGHISTGELFASYNLGDEYTSGHQIELVETGNEKTSAYSVTSTEIKIYADGKSQLNNGAATVKFSDNFIKLLGDNPNITVTPIGESEGLHIKEITKTGFTVKENKSGNSSVQFTWIAVGNRIDDKNKFDIPNDLTDNNFDKNMKEVMFNESDTKHSAKPIWWDGSKIRFDEIPNQKSKSVDVEEIINFEKSKSSKLKEPKVISEK